MMVMSVKNSLGGTGVVQELSLDDRLIDKPRIKTYLYFRVSNLIKNKILFFNEYKKCI